MNKEVKITPPDGYEVDKENSTFECIRFRPVKKGLPKTWEEFCHTHHKKEGEALINLDSDIAILEVSNTIRNPKYDKYLLPSLEHAQAILALCQLIQLRDCYNQGWQPDWNDDNLKYCITPIRNSELQVDAFYQRAQVLCFKTKGLCEGFLKNFKDLIEIARPVL